MTSKRVPIAIKARTGDLKAHIYKNYPLPVSAGHLYLVPDFATSPNCAAVWKTLREFTSNVLVFHVR